MNKVIVIFGPTGVGKTELSIELAKELNGEIISADSIQVYKGMDIGTAKITEKEMKGISHHMLDIISPNEEFHVGEYVKLTRNTIEQILSKGKTPIIVGGTGLYINSLIYNYDFAHTPKDESIREKYKKIVDEKGAESVYELLKNQDPERASKLHPNDVKRVIRALEIIEINKNNEKTEKKQEKTQTPFEYSIFGLNLTRENLYANIDARVEKMFANGLLNEVKSLIENGVKKESQSMQGIGYKEVIEGWEQNLSDQEIKELIQKHTRNYAKRQLTFMRGMKDLIWIDAGDKAKEKILDFWRKNGNRTN